MNEKQIPQIIDMINEDFHFAVLRKLKSSPNTRSVMTPKLGQPKKREFIKDLQLGKFKFFELHSAS